MTADTGDRFADWYDAEAAYVLVEQAATRVDLLDVLAVDRALEHLVCVPVRTPGAMANRVRLREVVSGDKNRARAFLAHLNE